MAGQYEGEEVVRLSPVNPLLNYFEGMIRFTLPLHFIQTKSRGRNVDNVLNKTGHSQGHFSIVPRDQVKKLRKFPQFKGGG